jgi:acetyl esterase/lipase
MQRSGIAYAICGLVAGLFLSSPLALAEVKTDVVYGHKDGMALTYDVFTPEKANGAGILFMVSGGWFSIWQPPEQRVLQLQPMLDAGFTVFAIHHGSAPKFKVPEAVSDVRAAVRHVKANASAYNVDPNRLGVFGGSAGGHLSLMLGLNSEGLPNQATGEGRARFMAPRYVADVNAPADLAAVVAYFPPVDLRAITGPNERFPALDFDAQQATAISPILFVTKNDPPVLLIHGTADTLVPITASTSIKEVLEETGVTNELIEIEGGDHGFRDPEHRSQATTAMVAWFVQYLK